MLSSEIILVPMLRRTQHKCGAWEQERRKNHLCPFIYPPLKPKARFKAVAPLTVPEEFF